MHIRFLNGWVLRSCLCSRSPRSFPSSMHLLHRVSITFRAYPLPHSARSKRRCRAERNNRLDGSLKGKDPGLRISGYGQKDPKLKEKGLPFLNGEPFFRTLPSCAGSRKDRCVDYLFFAGFFFAAFFLTTFFAAFFFTTFFAAFFFVAAFVFVAIRFLLCFLAFLDLCPSVNAPRHFITLYLEPRTRVVTAF